MIFMSSETCAEFLHITDKCADFVKKKKIINTFKDKSFYK